jgi:hypothetical protein
VTDIDEIDLDAPIFGAGIPAERRTGHDHHNRAQA